MAKTKLFGTALHISNRPVTFKDLQRLVQSENHSDIQPLSKLRDKPFWIWDQAKHKKTIRANKDQCTNAGIVSDAIKAMERKRERLDTMQKLEEEKTVNGIF